jgi:hypothetical protein
MLMFPFRGAVGNLQGVRLVDTESGNTSEKVRCDTISLIKMNVLAGSLDSIETKSQNERPTN